MIHGVRICAAMLAMLAGPVVAGPIPGDLAKFWQVIGHTRAHGGERLLTCGPSPRADDGTCYLASGADLWLWFENYRQARAKNPEFVGALPIRLPGEIGDPAISYTPVKDGVELPPATFVSVENRDAFAACWEAGRCEIAYGGACEAGLTKQGDEHFAQPVMPFYYVRTYAGVDGVPVEALYVNVYYAATRLPSDEGYARAERFFDRLLAMPPEEAANSPFDRPGTPLVPASVYDDFRLRQGQRG